MLMLESIPAENGLKETHTSPTLVESLRSHCTFLSYVQKNDLKENFDNHFSDVHLVADRHYVSLCSWSLHIEERKNKHLEDRIGK